MFDFEKLEVYKKAKSYNRSVNSFLEKHNLDKITYDQLKRASFSIMLNIAESTSRKADMDKCDFFVKARGSTFECVAIFDFLKDDQIIDEFSFGDFYIALDEISKMLFKLIKELE